MPTAGQALQAGLPKPAYWFNRPHANGYGPSGKPKRHTFIHARMARDVEALQLDWLQPWFRVSLGFSTAGIRRKTTIFNEDFICYGGSFFGVLAAQCVRYARDFARENPDIVEYFRTMPAPDEVS